MAFTVGDQRPIQNEHLRAPVVASFARAGNGVVRTFKIDYADYVDAVKLYLGWTELEGGILKRHLPYRDFIHQGMVATRAEVRGVANEGVDDGGDMPVIRPMNLARDFRYAFVTVWFESPHYQLGDSADAPDDPTLGAETNPETQRYCQKEVRPSKEAVTAKPGTLQWCDEDEFPIPDLRVQYEAPTLVSTADIVVQWMDLPIAAVPITAIKNCMGKTNNDTLPLPPWPPPPSASKEQLLLLTWSTADIFFPDDTLPNNGRGTSLTYFFKYRVQGFNHMLTPSGEYRRVIRAGTDVPGPSVGIYELADFTKLFKTEP